MGGTGRNTRRRNHNQNILYKKKNLVSIKEKESKTFLIRLCDVPSPHKYSLRASLGLIPT